MCPSGTTTATWSPPAWRGTRSGSGRGRSAGARWSPPRFDGRDITLSYAPILAELEERAQGIGLRPAFETVYIVPGHSAMQPLASANPRTLPVLEFRSHVGGRDITAQALADGTLPDTWFDLTDPEASAQMVRDALLLDDRTSPARLQTLTARTPAKLHESPSLRGPPAPRRRWSSGAPSAGSTWR
ncbi:hypothetical protein QP028_11200 [Corynebacterium suedekumii]|nr:hypothetical protein QP028_11200 [Corynebacterium suedekumii]